MASASAVGARKKGTASGRKQVAVGYLRRSTDRQEQSIPDQQKAIETYAEEHGFRMLRFYTDDAISGTSTAGRRAFQSLIADAKQKSRTFRFIIVYDVKRFGRVDNDEAGYYRHVLRQHGVEVLYVSENFSGDDTDDLIRPVKQWQARQESKDLSKVTIRGLLTKSQTGTWMGGVPPYGYDLRYESFSGEFLMHVRYMRDGSKQIFNERGRLQRSLPRGESLAVSRRDRCWLGLGEKVRVEAVRELFRLYVDERRGFKAVADTLNRRGTASPRGPEWSKQYSGNWSLTSVRAILVNPAYTGDLVWNRRTDARFHKIVDGRAVERPQALASRLELNDESDWIVVRDAHPPIVTRRVWEMARKLREEKEASRLQRGINQRTGKPAGPSENGSPSGGWTGPRSKFLLSGLMRCAQCGGRYEGHTQYRKSFDENGRRNRTLGYACGGYIRHGRHVCEIGRVGKDLLEQTIVEALVAFYEPFVGDDAHERIAAVLDEQLGGEVTQIAKTQVRFKARIRAIDKKVRTMIDNITATNRELIDDRVGELTLERERLEQRLESLTHLLLSKEESEEIIAETARFVAALKSSLTNQPLDQRQGAIRRCVEQIVVNHKEGECRITFRKIPMIVGGSLVVATRDVEAQLRCAGRP